jgi:hypothetical protein
MKKAMQRLAASTMLGLALVAGAVQQAAAQVYDCYYDYSVIVLYSDGTWEGYDVYTCYPAAA